MKKNRTLIITVILCLLPMIVGIVFFDKLPDKLPIHFNMKNEVDNYADKNFVLFGLPVIMAILQAICMLSSNYRINKDKLEKPKVVKIFEKFIPTLTIVLYIITIDVGLGSSVSVGKIICFVLGIIFIFIGNYMPKMNYETGKVIFHPNLKTEKGFRRMSKIFGYSFIIVGIILLIMTISV